VEIRSGEHLLVCDGGTGIIPLGEELMAAERMPATLVVFTHYHWDHICGLPFFQPAFSPAWKLRFFGPGETAKDIEQRLSNQMKSPYFPVEIETWLADIEYVVPVADSIAHGPFTITYHHAHHPGVTYGYRVDVGGKVLIYMSDNEVNFLRTAIARRADEFSADEHRMIARMQSEERAAELGAVRGADILIHDAQYNPHDYAKKRGWGHSCYIDAVNFAIDAEVKALYLYHHDPTYDDAQIEAIHRECEQLAAQRGSKLEIQVAREGEQISL